MSHRIKQADTALSMYYKIHDTEYFNVNMIGKFQEWAEDNDFDSDGIEEEFNMKVTDSCLIEIDDNFPPNKLDAQQMFQVLKKCWSDPNSYNNEINKNESIVRKESLSEGQEYGIVVDYYPEINKTKELFCAKSITTFEPTSRSELIITGYIRMNKIVLKVFPESIVQIICHFYYHKFYLVPFSTNRLDPEVESNPQDVYYKLSYNNIMVTAKKNVFCVSKSKFGYRTGIHVFRYTIHGIIRHHAPYLSNTEYMLWGIQACLSYTKMGDVFGEQYGHKSRKTQYVQGWYSSGNNNHGKANLMKDIFQKKYETSEIFDLKLNCNENTLSFVAVSIDNEAVKDNFNKQTTIDIPENFTNKHGWVPYIYLGSNSVRRHSVIIAEINTNFYGITCNQVDSKAMYFITDELKENIRFINNLGKEIDNINEEILNENKDKIIQYFKRCIIDYNTLKSKGNEEFSRDLSHHCGYWGHSKIKE
eukprot:170438_1